jgi:quercetin dioxygenase-like cupin family protein
VVFRTTSDQTTQAWRPGVTTQLKAAASLGAQTLCVFEQRFQSGTGAPAHRHPEHEEVVLVLDGVADFDVEGDIQHLSEGAVVIIPPGVVHSFVNTGQVDLRTIAIFADASPTVVYAGDPEVVYAIGAVDPHSDDHRTLLDQRSD